MKGVNIIKNLYVSGYRSYELNIFSDEDEKVFFIKAYFKRRIAEYIEQGLEWVIIGGQLGVEQWVGEVVIELKELYPEIQLGILLPYAGFASKWNEKNQHSFNELCQKADYVNYTSNQEYKHPGQLKGNQAFILDHTDGALLFYDLEKEGKPKYLYDSIVEYQSNSSYELELLSFDELQWFVTEFEETRREELS